MLPTPGLLRMGNLMVTWPWRSKVKVMSRMGVKYQKLSFSSIYIHHRDQIVLPTPRLRLLGMENLIVIWPWRSNVKVMSIMGVKYWKWYFSSVYIHYRDQIMLHTPGYLIWGIQWWYDLEGHRSRSCPEWGKVSKLSFSYVYIYYIDKIVLPTPRLLGMGNLMVIRPWRWKVNVMSRMGVSSTKNCHFISLYTLFRWNNVTYP